MPELPEVETTVRDLKKYILGRKIEDVWSDTYKLIKKPKSFSEFKKKLTGRKIENIQRKGKNILLRLSGNGTLLIHQKMTGHLLYGKWQITNSKWQSKEKGPLEEPVNRFIHLMLWLSGRKMLALSDLRKFAKIEFWDNLELENSKGFKILGPDPLEKSFTFKKFKSVIKKKPKGKVKQILMDQLIISGIGNIYSDEILWVAEIHPFTQIVQLSDAELKGIYVAVKKILAKAIKLKGDSMSDYRLITGKKGGYQNVQNVYQQEGKKCPRKDGGIIKRIKIGGRSAHFCPVCQQLKQ